MSGRSQGQGEEEGPVSVNQCQAGQARKRSRPAGRAIGAQPEQEEAMQSVDLPPGTASLLSCVGKWQGLLAGLHCAWGLEESLDIAGDGPLKYLHPNPVPDMQPAAPSLRLSSCPPSKRSPPRRWRCWRSRTPPARLST
jgi:hypothetical protein